MEKKCAKNVSWSNLIVQVLQLTRFLLQHPTLHLSASQAPLCDHEGPEVRESVLDYVRTWQRGRVDVGGEAERECLCSDDWRGWREKWAGDNQDELIGEDEGGKTDCRPSLAENRCSWAAMMKTTDWSRDKTSRFTLFSFLRAFRVEDQSRWFSRCEIVWESELMRY